MTSEWLGFQYQAELLCWFGVQISRGMNLTGITAKQSRKGIKIGSGGDKVG